MAKKKTKKPEPKKVVKKAKKKVAKPKEEETEIVILTERVNNLSNRLNEYARMIGNHTTRVNRIVEAISKSKKVTGL